MVIQTNGNRDILNRRRFIELIGVSSAALAGCLGGGNSGAGGGKKSQHITCTDKVPANLQWNPSNTKGAPSISHLALFDSFAKYNLARGEFEPYAISDWKYGGDTFEMTVRDGLTWANGDDVTAGDIATQLRIGLYTDLPYASYTDSIETPDEKTLVMNFNSVVNQKIVEFNVIADRIVQQKKSVFGKYLDQIEQNEKKGLRELTKFAWDEPIASGPFAFKSVDQQQLALKRRDDHPDSGNINFDEYVFRYLDGNNSIHQALINKQIDSAFTVFTPPRIVKQLPDAIKQIQTPAAWGYGLVPNHNHKHVGDRAVRQAIQHVIDREQVVKNVGKVLKITPKLPVGIASKYQKQWLGEAMSDFDTYGMDSSQTQKATKILENAGYSKQGGTWTDSDGKPIKLPIIVPSAWTDWVTATETIVDQLGSFGFDAVMDGRSYGTLSSSIWPNGDFTLAAGTWLYGAPQGAYPYFSLLHQLVNISWGEFKYNYPAAIESYGGNTKDITVPSRTGSGTMTTNPSEQITKLASSTKKSEINDIVLEQAWVSNQDLPIIAVMEKFEQTFLTDGKEWNIPKPDADVAQVRWANTWLPRKGKMQYTGN